MRQYYFSDMLLNGEIMNGLTVLKHEKLYWLGRDCTAGQRYSFLVLQIIDISLIQKETYWLPMQVRRRLHCRAEVLLCTHSWFYKSWIWSLKIEILYIFTILQVTRLLAPKFLPRKFSRFYLGVVRRSHCHWWEISRCELLGCELSGEKLFGGSCPKRIVKGEIFKVGIIRGRSCVVTRACIVHHWYHLKNGDARQSADMYMCYNKTAVIHIAYPIMFKENLGGVSIDNFEHHGIMTSYPGIEF